MYAVVPAAGMGRRMEGLSGNRSKALLVLADGTPVITRTLQALAASGVCDGVVIAARADDQKLIEAALGGVSKEISITFVEGGETRQESVYRALLALQGRAEYVLIHDAARPLCPPELIRDVAKRVRATGAALLAIPAHATLKFSADGELVQKTVSRDGVWLAQTPQVFRYDLIMEAHETARSAGFVGTDDAELVERIGGEVMLVRGTEQNMKITTPNDLAAVKAFRS